MTADPSLQMLLLAPLKGPFGVPAYVFEQATWDRVLN